MMWLLLLVVIFMLMGGLWWGWPLLAGLLGVSAVADKPGALAQIAQLMRNYDISLHEVETACNAAAHAQPAQASRSKGDIAKTLFVYLGAIFILAGIGTYVSMFWASMGSVMRVVVTLGVGYILLIVLVSALHEKKFPRLILPLTLAAAFMLTSGWFVFIHEVFPRGDNWRLAVLAVFGMMTLHQGLLFGKFRLTVLAFTALFFAYGFMQVGLDLLHMPYAYIAIILGGSLYLVAQGLEATRHRLLAAPAFLLGAIWLYSGLFERIANVTSPAWANFIIGVCVMLTAYGLQQAGRHGGLASLAYFFGSLMAYAGLFDLLHNTAFELLYLGVTASVLYACVVLQSRALLFTTVLVMLGFIGFYTSRHFAHSLGWPVSLVLMGVAFLGIGTLALKVKQKM